MYLQQNKRVFLTASFFCLAIAAAGLITTLLPFDIKSVPLTAARMRQYSPLFVLGGIYISAALFAVYRILQHLEGRISLLGFSTQVGTMGTKSALGIPTLIGVGILSLVILSQSIGQLGSPMDWDELDTVTRLVSPQLSPIDETNPYQNRDVISPSKNTRNHTIASLASWMSMKIFGVGKLAARFPALIFTAGFLAIAATWGLSLFSAPVVLFTLFHLGINGLFIWYTHSMRGYISMSLVCLMALFLVMQNPRQTRRWSGVVLVACGLACALTHAFGGIFYLLLILSYLFWVATESPGMSETEVKAHWLRLSLCLIPIPLILYILVHQYFFLSHIGYLYTQVPLEKPEPLNLLLGVNAQIARGFIIAWIAALVIASSFRKARRDVLTVFLGLSTITFSILILSLKTTLFEARFLLAFVPPFVLWAARTIESISNPSVRGAFIAAAVTFLVVLPFQSRGTIYQTRTEKTAAYDHFIDHIKDITKGTPAFCLSAEGNADESRFTRGIFFHAKDRVTSSSACERHFLAYFSRDWQGEHLLSSTILSQLTELYHDEMGRTLYEEHPFPNPNRLARL